MSPTSMKRDIVFFLGAGFSHDAGLPMMSDFGNFSTDEYTKLCTEGGTSKRSFGLLKEAARVFRSFQYFCRSALKAEEACGASDPAGNMETLFCIAEAMREAQVPPAFARFPEDPSASEPIGESMPIEADYLLQQVQLWLWEVYNCFPPLDRKRAESLGGKELAYERFFGLINKTGMRERITLITTNYDLIAEYYSWALKDGEPCAYPLRAHWDYSLLEAGDRIPSPYAPYGFVDAWEHEPNALVLCKLHGSVNFFETVCSGQPRLGACIDTIEAGQTIGGSRITCYSPPPGSIHDPEKCKYRPAIFAQDAIWSLRERYGNTLFPAIVPPTYAKLQGQPWLRRIWNAAFRAIQTAKAIVFVGYSLPPSDGFMRAMFQGALASRQGKPPEVYVVNPFEEESGLERYAQLFHVSLKPHKEDGSPGLYRMKFHKAVEEDVFARILDSI